jgi:hypothetical protein
MLDQICVSPSTFDYDFLSTIIQNLFRSNLQELESSDESYSVVIDIDIYELDTDIDNIDINDTDNHNVWIGPRQLLKNLGSYNKINTNDPLITNKDKCPICCEQYCVGEFKRQLSDCKHFFHKKCVDKWFCKEHAESGKMSCPVCRLDYSSQVC